MVVLVMRQMTFEVINLSSGSFGCHSNLLDYQNHDYLHAAGRVRGRGAD